MCSCCSDLSLVRAGIIGMDEWEAADHGVVRTPPKLEGRDWHLANVCDCAASASDDTCDDTSHDISAQDSAALSGRDSYVAQLGTLCSHWAKQHIDDWEYR